ncbi:unnamed protein product [Arabis nemorensis]|uniref:Uncharacterized protein n=1 Tax=Arabis nemorensis TaxID=586526 RepID=A0A565CHB0_9BRAS|nr:unnamed protein product [Arabis nemorensis]
MARTKNPNYVGDSPPGQREVPDDPDVGDDDDAMGFSGVIQGGVVPDNIAQDETMLGDAGENMRRDAADAPETWRNELLALKGQMKKMFSEMNMKIEGLGTRDKSIESALRLEREAYDYNRGFDHYNPGFEEVQPAAVQPDATEEVQPDAADEVQPSATDATIDSTEAEKTGAEEVQSDAIESEKADAKKVQIIRKMSTVAASSDVPAQATQKIKIIGKTRGSTIVIRSHVATRQRHKTLEW